MGMIGRLPNGEEVMLPHPDIPCAWCGRFNMDWNACPNARDICNYCCGEEEEYDVDPWSIVKAVTKIRHAQSGVFLHCSRIAGQSGYIYAAMAFLLISKRLSQDVAALIEWLEEHQND